MEISGLLIPTDEDQPVELISWEQGEYQAIQRAVGGTFDVVDIDSLKLSAWINDEGKLQGLEVNHRATMLLWAAEPAWRGYDVLVGPVLLTGVPDNEGDTQSVPGEFVKLVLETPEYRVQVKTSNSGGWRKNNQVFMDYFSACRYASDLIYRHNSVVATEIVPA